MILQKRLSRLVGFATCGSPRGSRNEGRRRRRRPGQERVGSWSLGNGLRSGSAGAKGHPIAGCSDRGKCLEICGLRCLYNAVLLELQRKMELVLQ